MAEQTEILEIRLETDQLKKSGQEAAGVLELLKDKQKKLKKANAEGSAEYQKNTAAIQGVSKELKEINTVIDLNDKAMKEQKGSVQEMRDELKRVTLKWKELSKEERENTKEGKALVKSKTELTGELKKLEKQTGDNRRNVGNYTDAIGKAVEGNAGFAGSIITVGKAFIANPIGAILTIIVGALGLLYKAFTRNEEGSAKVQKALGYVTGAFQGLLQILEPVAEFMIDKVVKAFEAPGESIDLLFESLQSFAGFLKDEFLRLLKETGAVFTALAKGDFAAAGEAAMNALDAFTNLIPGTLLLKEGAKALSNNWEEVSETMKASVKNAQDLAGAQLALDRAIREQQKTQLQFMIQAERLRQIRDDEAVSIEERIRANEELSKVLEEQQKAENVLAQKALDLALIKINLEGRSKENLDALAEAQLKFLEIQERVEGQASEQLVNTNSLLRDKQTLIDETAAKNLETSKKVREVEKVLSDEKLSADEKELQSVRDKYTNILIIIQESGASEVEMERLKNEALLAQTEELKTKETEIDTEATETRIANAQKEQDIRDKLHDDAVTGAATTAQSIQSISDENSRIFKAAAISETVINTYASATAAFKAMAGIPVIGPIAAAAASAAALASGFANVASIASAKRGGVMKAKRGAAIGSGPGYSMYEAGGNLHSAGGTMYYGEDGNQFEVERDEILTVMNRNSSAMMKRMSDLNVAGGGVSFMKRGGTPVFQDGGVAAIGAGRSATSQASSSREIREIMASLPPQFVSVVEFEAVQNRLRIIEHKAES
tara:strand:- start:5637 stop:7982 length:2346 start_codon:yes stop_codon:yes gene_type:complete